MQETQKKLRASSPAVAFAIIWGVKHQMEDLSDNLPFKYMYIFNYRHSKNLTENCLQATCQANVITTTLWKPTTFKLCVHLGTSSVPQGSSAVYANIAGSEYRNPDLHHLRTQPQHFLTQPASFQLSLSLRAIDCSAPFSLRTKTRKQIGASFSVSRQLCPVLLASLQVHIHLSLSQQAETRAGPTQNPHSYLPSR